MGNGDKDPVVEIKSCLNELKPDTTSTTSTISTSAALLEDQVGKPEPGVDPKERDKTIKTLAKSLPKVTKGTVAAIKAFQKGDNLTGAAEIMNIFAAGAPLVGSLATAGGPGGMLAGAIFSMIAQIIAVFQPPKESDVDKIKAFLLEIEADGVKQKADANLISIGIAAQRMRDQADKTAIALKKIQRFSGSAATKSRSGGPSRWRRGACGSDALAGHND